MLKDSQKIIYIRILIISSLALACFMFLHNILNGYSAFWFDPARDFILALNNLEKLSLIGSPTGIPSLFYGPYWIWLLSLGMTITKDPALIIILLQVIPYFVIFPFLMFKFKTNFSRAIILSLLWLFYLSSGNYIVQIWNVNYAPIIFLAITYLVITPKSKKTITSKLIYLFTIAALSALLVNFHFSFGFAIALSTALFVGINELINIANQNSKIKSKIIQLMQISTAYILGLLVIEAPFIAFEARHNFLQTKAIIRTLTEAFLYHSAVVGQTGLKKNEILNQIIFGKPAHVLGINIITLEVIYALIAISMIYILIKQRRISIKIPKTLGLYLLTSIIALTVVYTGSKNPIFDYHFAGYEIIILLIVAIVAKNSKTLKLALFLWVSISVAFQIISFFKNYNYVQYKGTPLWVKQAIVKSIYEDAKNLTFKVYAYSPAIYTYDYDYLFLWLGTDYYKNLPQQNGTNNLVTYLIIPDTSKGIYYDFINYKTPNTIYNSQKIWLMIDGTTIIKRQPKTN